MYLMWVIIGTLVIGVELSFWLIFRKKLTGLCFPEKSDESFFRFFTRRRLKLITIAQGVFLLGTFFISSYFLW